MNRSRIVVVGASAGGVRALTALAKGLAPSFPAPILVVQHVGPHPSILPALLSKAGSNPASHAADGEKIAPGRILIAPPDHHLLVEGDVVRVSRGPKENHSRPAIDPLFRSAALSWGPAVIGVVLTGSLDDGTAGLQAIKRCGGTAIVQDPDDAEVASMPASAMHYVDVDHRAKLAEIPGLLLSLATSGRERPAGEPPAAVVHENDLILRKGDLMEHLEAIATPSTFVCPDCKGALWKVTDSKPERFLCHAGHGFTLRTLQDAQSESTDEALWSGVRALQEKGLLLKEMAQGYRRERDLGEAQRLESAAQAAQRNADHLRAVIQKLNGTDG